MVGHGRGVQLRRHSVMSLHAVFAGAKKGVILRGVILLTCLSVTFAVGNLRAAQGARVPCGTCDDPDRFVRLESSNIVGPERSFNHPINISAENWITILRSVRLQSRSERFPFIMTEGPVMPAFTDEEIGYLSTTLSKAFSVGRPDEVIVFGLFTQRSPPLVEITTGGWFVENDFLHLVMANHRETVTLPSIRKLLWAKPLRSQNSELYSFVPGSHITPVQREEQWRLPFVSPLPEIAVAYKALLLTDLDIQSENTPSSRSPSSSLSSSKPVDGGLSIEERLRRLRRLKEQGLISEEEYGTKKQQLLDSL